MNDLYTVGYKDEGPFFLSNFGQVTRCVRIHGVHNEEAIDRNTEAIIEQTEMQHSESDESQVQFSGHSMMLERESNETQQILQHEFDETQDVLRDQGSGIKNAITAQTNELKNEIEGVIDELEAIANKIELNTSGDVTNSNNIARAIQNLRLIVNP